MNKLKSFALSLLLIFGLSFTAHAQIATSCIPSTESGWCIDGPTLKLRNGITSAEVGDNPASTTSGITASTTQTQGQGLLTSELNQVATVGNPNDVVTLTTASIGLRRVVINDGANNLQIFPNTGDNVGAGVNISVVLQVNETVVFVAYDATNWKVESATETLHVEIHDEDNTNAFVVNAINQVHLYHTNGLVSGDITTGWTFDAGGAGTSIAIASIADGGAGEIAVTTSVAHGLAVGDIISQTNLTNAAYRGPFVVNTITSSTIYEVTATFTATGTGTMDQAATFTAGSLGPGFYEISVWVSATSATNNETFDYQVFNNAVGVVGTKIRRKFGTSADFGSFSGGGVLAVASGDKISFGLTNTSSAGNLTIRNLTIVLIRL